MTRGPCPCRSGATYMECCRPAHTGERPPALPRDLVRARYSAFAIGLGEFLHATLADAHPDRAHGTAVPARIAELSRSGRTLKYMGVVVSEADDARALFLAKVFEKGKDRSFMELSRFVVEEGTLRYASGILLPRTALPNGGDAMDIASYEALAKESPDVVVG